MGEFSLTSPANFDIIKRDGRKGGILTENKFRHILKNASAIRILKDSPSHAYLIDGPAGSGKFTLALYGAAASLCKSKEDDGTPCGVCGICSRILRGIHPDVSVFTREEKKSIGVDVARSLRSQVFITPNESERRFFIIREADLMTPEAQNALLISLEEPPPFSVFFLLASDRTRMLETVRSRCTPLSTERLEDEVIRDALESTPEGGLLSHSDPAALDRIIREAEGVLGRGLAAVSSSSAEEDERAALARRVIQVSVRGSGSERVHLASEIPKGRDSLEAVLTLTLYGVRDIISQKLRTGVPSLLYGPDGPDRSLTTVTLPRLCALARLLEDSLAAVRANASQTLIWESVIMHRI